jgi:hypothetical protein
MILPGETEAGSAGMHPCRGIAWWAHRDDDRRRGNQLLAPLSPIIGSKDPDALKIPARRAESTLTENARPPFQAEPEHFEMEVSSNRLMCPQRFARHKIGLRFRRHAHFIADLMYDHCSRFQQGMDKVMGMCPGESCRADTIPSDSGEYCAICGGPTQACSRCGTLNRSFAQQCRSCCAPFKFRDVLNGPYSSVVKKWSTPDKHLLTQERFWVAPIAFSGWLWLLSVEGQLSRYSPFSGSLAPVVHLGEEFGRTAPMARCQIPAGDRWTQPGIVALSERGVVAVGMLDSREIKIDLDPDETAVADFNHEPCGVDGGEKEAYLLTRRNALTYFTLANLVSGKVERRLLLPENRLAGPFRCGGCIYVYSETQLHVVAAGQVRSDPFPKGFKACVEPRNQTLHQAFGRLPFMVTDSLFYIPGNQSGRPVFFMQRGGRGVSGGAIIPVGGETTYTQDGTGRPVLAQESAISILEGAVSTIAEADPQLSARHPALVVNGTTVGMAEPSSSSHRLRIYNGDARSDFLVQKETFRESVGVFPLGNSLTFCSTLKDATVGIYSWLC